VHSPMGIKAAGPFREKLSSSIRGGTRTTITDIKDQTTMKSRMTAIMRRPSEAISGAELPAGNGCAIVPPPEDTVCNATRDAPQLAQKRSRESLDVPQDKQNIRPNTSISSVTTRSNAMFRLNITAVLVAS